MRRQIAIAAILLTLVSCRKDPSRNQEAAGIYRVTFQSGLALEINGSNTKAAGQLPANSTISASAFKRANTSAANIIGDTWIDARSYVIQADGSAIPTLVNDDGTVKTGDAKDMELSNGTYDFYAHSPALKVESDNYTIKGIPHYTDFMSAVVPAKSVSRSSAQVDLTFEHKCSKIQFQIKSVAGMETASLVADSVILYKMATTPAADYTLGGDITPTVGAITDTCLLGQIIPAADGKSVAVWDVLLPKSTATFNGDFHVKVNGTPYVLKAKDIPAMSFSKGNHYLFTALVKQGSVSLVLDVVSWTSVSGSHTPGEGGQIGGGSWGESDGNFEVGTENSLVIGNWDNVSWDGGIGGNFDWIDGSLVVSSWKPVQFPVEAGSGNVQDVNSWVAKTLSAQTGQNNSGLVDNWGGNNGGTEMGVATANCYMVAPGQSISFDGTVKGNGNAKGAALDTKSVEILWTDGRSVMSYGDATFNPATGMVTVATSTSGIGGNAVIVAKDGSYNTIWSWHIWVTDYKPKGQAAVAANTAYNVTGGQVHTYGTQFLAKNPGKVIMDRNLGATKTYYVPVPGGASVDDVRQSFGLLYQWGRKDPLPGWDGVNVGPSAAIIGLFNNYGYGMDGSQTIAIDQALVSGQDNTLSYAIQNPLTFIYNTTPPYDWYTKGVQDDTLWGDGGTKSIYDPCPVGWRIAPDGTWSDFTRDATTPANGTFPYYTNGYMAEGSPSSYMSNGRLYEPKTGNVKAWYPVPGNRDGGSNVLFGALGNVGSYGYSWSSMVRGSSGVRLDFYSGGLNPSYTNYRGCGFQVRCVQE